jgi:DNA repair exonuclease SbcCD ATPase subunit
MGYEPMEMTAEEIRQGAYTGDKEKDLQMINAFLSGNVSVKQQEVSNEKPATLDNTVTETSTEGETVTEPDFDAEEEERKRRYEQFLKEKELAAQIEEERKKQLLIAKQKEEEIKKEREARLELEKKLKELSELQQTKTQQQSTTDSYTDDSEEEFVSDYAKGTREKVDRLESLINEFGSNHPKVKELEEEIRAFREEFKVVMEERQRKAREEEEKRQRDKLYGGIREFQNRYPELKTTVDIEEVDRQYQQFRNDMAVAIKAKSIFELEQAIADYFAGGDYKKIADEKGIKAPADYDKYQAIVELYDMKRGVKYDPVTGKENPILNDEGQRVTYRSLEEAYYVKNREKELTDMRRRSSQEIAKKISQINGGAVELPSNMNGQVVQQGYTKDQVNTLLNTDIKAIINDPVKLDEFKRLSIAMGYDAPVYRGRKLW